MATTKKNAPKEEFKQTFRRYADMTTGEQDAFRQGAKTVENKVKENLGFKKRKDED